MAGAAAACAGTLARGCSSILALVLIFTLVAPASGFLATPVRFHGSWNKVGRCSVAPLGARLETRWGALQLSASGNEDSRSEAEKEAAEWAEMAAKMEPCSVNTPHLKQAQKASSKDAPKIAGTGDKANMGISDLDALQGQKLEAFAHSAHPMGMARAPGRGELDVLQARAEAFKKKQQQATGATAPVRPQPTTPDIPRRWQGPALKGEKVPQRLVGGDAGSLRQAAPYQPGDSKAGAAQEGWTEDQLEKILEEERKWKEQVAAKQAEEAAASQLAAAGARFKVGPKMSVEKGVPSTMESSVVQALVASLGLMKKGCGRFRIDVDTSGGDETYTTLKNSVPFTRVFARALAVNDFSRVRLVFGDAGAAALAVRDWAGEDGYRVSSFERSGLPRIDDDDDVVMVVAPAAGEIETLRSLADKCAELGIPVILINPSVKSPGGENLGSLGLYSLALSDFLSSFEYCYFLRTLPWGLILRQAPGAYEVYQNGARPGAFDLLEATGTLPQGEALEEIFLAANPQEAKEGIEGVAQKFGRFMQSYTKG